jgi:hypothetical protein
MAGSFLLGGWSHHDARGLLCRRACCGVAIGDKDGAAYTKSTYRGHGLPHARDEEGGDEEGGAGTPGCSFGGSLPRSSR